MTFLFIDEHDIVCILYVFENCNYLQTVYFITSSQDYGSNNNYYSCKYINVTSIIVNQCTSGIGFITLAMHY